MQAETVPDRQAPCADLGQLPKVCAGLRLINLAAA
jgi:hypothetical protein